MRRKRAEISCFFRQSIVRCCRYFLDHRKSEADHGEKKEAAKIRAGGKNEEKAKKQKAEKSYSSCF